jgi:hypothetical protein
MRSAVLVLSQALPKYEKREMGKLWKRFSLSLWISKLCTIRERLGSVSI